MKTRTLYLKRYCCGFVSHTGQQLTDKINKLANQVENLQLFNTMLAVLSKASVVSMSCRLQRERERKQKGLIENLSVYERNDGV